MFSCAAVDFVRVKEEKFEGRVEGKGDGRWWPEC